MIICAFSDSGTTRGSTESLLAGAVRGVMMLQGVQSSNRRPIDVSRDATALVYEGAHSANSGLVT